ncbi:hypothetical protein [Ferruginibacter albus]|uniref:hypothetical protein n=1 Tax=Ferruginibacter albus TaxID=2875540 RepID=UPI001CC7125D|nr:hypothetical protein [Ferruginibacter albus]UAY53215.1 hypothetical protein K9M53_05975 [Ferruginibacter albus]
MEGNNSNRMKEIMNDKTLMSKFMDYAMAPDSEKNYFKFVRYRDTGRLDIVDNRKKENSETPQLVTR